MARTRLLFLAQTLPYPANSGVNIRTYNILRLLAGEYDVTALCFYRKGARPSLADVANSVQSLAPIAAVQAFPIPQEHSHLRWVWDHARSVLTQRPYTYYAYASRDFRHALTRELADGGYALVHVDSLDLAYYVRSITDVPVVCVHHNVESALLARRASTEDSALRRAYIRLQANLTLKEERALIGSVALNVAVSADDAERLKDIDPASRVVVVPNGVDTESLSPVDTPQLTDRLVFVGGYHWFPNGDALHYFCEKILPIIRQMRPGISVRWIGKCPTHVRLVMSDRYGIDVTGFVDDIRAEVSAASCYVVPLRVGGGTRLKILDAWSLGKAVVSTSVGCEGLEATHEMNILIADDPAEFARAVARILEDERLRRRLERNARATVVKTYDWDLIGNGMLREYRRISSADVPLLASSR